MAVIVSIRFEVVHSDHRNIPNCRSSGIVDPIIFNAIGSFSDRAQSQSVGGFRRSELNLPPSRLVSAQRGLASKDVHARSERVPSKFSATLGKQKHISEKGSK